ncbi:putative late blight resistance protein homolog R1A-10 [Salvia miltiorrhiza]|uniref:putative late blight resistance protein homolog R1A-10 n=1 Tax=Salvia miltiorrhiza TaxID=226208 RepID=UPI0025AD2299|nr:putative late blight resistance protein homolog R1A-10 [Salvia miltiorrhiza]
MAVYAALFPLKSKIRGYLKHYDACFDPPSLELTQYLYKEVVSFQEFVERLGSSSRERMKASLAHIAEAIPKFHDLLSLHLLEQYTKVPDQRNRRLLRLGLPQEEEEASNQMSRLIDLRHLKRDIHSFIQTLKKVKEEYEKEDDESTIDLCASKTKMVGLSDQRTELKEDLVRAWSGAVQLLSVVGMAGIGKTTLARKIYQDLDFAEWFDCRAWVAVGREWQLQEIIRIILAQVNSHEMLSVEDDDERESEYLRESLKGKRYLIVLDDVWDAQVWHDIKKLLTTTQQRGVVGSGGSRFLLISRMQEVADRVGSESGITSLDMRLMNKDESWDLLREKVFAAESCSFQLEKTGRKIAEKCDGLPLTIVKVAHLLSGAEKTVEYWNEVATQEKHQLFRAAYDEVSKVLYPSYENLPQHLKMCLLYVGVFPQKDEIPTSKVINMWLAEGLLLQQNKAKSLRKHALKCLDELASSNVMVYKKSTRSSSTMSIADKGIKVCGLHYSWWHLCQNEARKSNFYRVLNSRGDSSEESIKGQSRLCFHKNILLGIKEVYDSMEDNCASSARSLLFYGPYSRYPIPLCSALKLLEVLDALNIRFYEFPLQVFELVELKYVALTYDGELPPSISKLHKLQFLIVCPHQHIKSCGAFLYLPQEIWDIKDLKHLHVTGSDLPDLGGTPLPNLLTLLDVSAHSCTRGAFERIHNLRKLGIRIELPPDHGGEPLNCFDHVSILKNLKSLKCVVVNPELRSELVPPPTLANFPVYLKKLALSGMGYPWSEMSKIASLAKLQVLKLRCNAFQGPKWEIEENKFPALEYLLIEDCDLEHWKVATGNFKWLEHLSIKHCYNLRELHWDCEDNISMIEVDDCDLIVEKQIKEAKWGKGMLAADFTMHYSWTDGKLKSRQKSSS